MLQNNVEDAQACVLYGCVCLLDYASLHSLLCSLLNQNACV